MPCDIMIHRCTSYSLLAPNNNEDVLILNISNIYRCSFANIVNHLPMWTTNILCYTDKILFDKQVNVQKESLKKNLWGFMQAHIKVYNENVTEKIEGKMTELKYF